MNGRRQITRSAGVIGGATLGSRVLGLIRDMVMTHLFGTGLVAEAFYVAFMIPALLRRLVGEGSLTVAFIPVFTKFRQEHGEDEARRLFSSFWTLVTIVLAAMVVLGMVFSKEIVTLFTNPEFRVSSSGKDTERFLLAVLMTREMFPYLLLIGLTALSMGALNSYKHFFAPAAHPVLLNVAWISSVLLLHHRFPQAGFAIVIGVLAGGLLQLALQVPFLLGKGLSLLPRFNFRHPAIKRIGKLMLPSAFAVGIVQINTLVATYFVTAFEGGRSQLFYASRLTEFPYAIFSLAIATAILPVLSEQAGEKDLHSLRQTLSFGMRMAAFIIIPASIGLAFVAAPLVHIIYEHGAFTSADTGQTSAMLVMFCLGLWAVAGLRLVVQAFYAVEDMKTPVWAAALGMAANIAGCFYFSGLLGREGVPLAISIAAAVHVAVLWTILPKRVGKVHGAGLLKTIIKSIAASLPMAAVVFFLSGLPIWSETGRLGPKVALLAAEVLGGMLLYAAFARLLRMGELGELAGAFARKLGKG